MMKARQHKSQAHASQAGTSHTASFGGSGSFGRASSSISYLVEQPDLASLSDPNVAVSFKNLSKRDSITKSKALDELHSYVSTQQEGTKDLEEAFVEAWVKCYPRASVDVARRVRQSAHGVQGKVAAASGKRMAKHMPLVISPWFLGLHDNDRGVARVAQDALYQVFATPEKQAGLKRVYQGAILDFCSNVINNESAQTLSDERNTTAEDSEAVYSRVLSSSIAAVTDIIMTVDMQELHKQRALYSDLIASRKLWTFSSSKDTQSRRVVFRFLKACFSNFADEVADNENMISKALLSKQTMRHQSGTSLDYTDVLALLTSRNSQIWAQPGEKSSVNEKLQSLVKNGSQLGTSRFWLNVKSIILKLPPSTLSSSLEQSKDLLNAMRHGLTQKLEPRSNVEDAMACYFATLQRLALGAPEGDAKDLVSNMGMPFVHHFLTPASTSDKWALPTKSGLSIVANGLQMEPMGAIAIQQWPNVTKIVTDDIRTSLPEQSIEFDSSQKQVELEGNKLFSLLAELMKLDPTHTFNGSVKHARSHVLSESIDLLKARNGKPFGAAGCILAILKRGDAADMLRDNELGPMLKGFVREEVPRMIMSPSQSRLVSLLYYCHASSVFTETWNATLDAMISGKDPLLRRSAVQDLLMCRDMPQDFTHASQNENLQRYILEQCQTELGEGKESTFISQMLARASTVLAQTTTDALLVTVTENLLHEESMTLSLSILKQLSTQHKSPLKQYLATAPGSDLLQNLLRVQEHGDETDARIAAELSRVIGQLTSSMPAQESTSPTAMIQRRLREANTQALSVGTLVDFAVQKSQSAEKPHSLNLYPSVSAWADALEPYLKTPLPSSFVITDDFGAAGLLTQKRAGETETPTSTDVDLDGLSSSMRMAMYSARLLSHMRDDTEKHLQPVDRFEIYRLLALTARLANDKLTYSGANSLWITRDEEIENEILDMVSEANKTVITALVQEVLKFDAGTPDEWPDSLPRRFWQATKGNSTSSLHHGRVFATLMSQAVEKESKLYKHLQGIQEVTKNSRRGQDPFVFPSLLVAFRSLFDGQPVYDRMLNEVIAELTSIDPEAQPEQLLRGLSHFDILTRDLEGALSAAKQRTIFFVKNMLKCLSSGTVSDISKSLVCKALTIAAQSISEIYGEHWKQMIEFLLDYWPNSTELDASASAGDTIVLWHSSLTLFAALRTISVEEDAADDLKELLAESQSDLSHGMIKLVTNSASISDESNQPLRITNELLARQVKHNLPSAATVGDNDLYAVINAESHAVQQTAFNVLHRQIPRAQEDISLSAALDKKVARLPEELSSLILQAPSAESLEGLSFERQMPSFLFAYLSSWLLVFDHFRNASDKVKTDYAANLRKNEVLPNLMALVFTFLGHAKSRPLDASRFDAANYSFDIEDSPMKDVQWLLIHLYYLSLKRIPSLTKAWWIDCKSRQIKTQVEPWTIKYFSPLVQSDALSAVTEWYETQDSKSPDSITVKVSPTTSSVTASKEIDDQAMSIVITLPPNFPLGQVTVTDGHRVAVDQKRWNAWKMNTQGVIAFSDNSISDGLMAWKRNVVGQLKGQTECAICYSIVSGDKQLPTKKCGTCSNLFHGSCLYRWFKSSNSSSCPLCRTAFNYA